MPHVTLALGRRTGNEVNHLHLFTDGKVFLLNYIRAKVVTHTHRFTRLRNTGVLSRKLRNFVALTSFSVFDHSSDHTLVVQADTFGYASADR